MLWQNLKDRRERASFEQSLSARSINGWCNDDPEDLKIIVQNRGDELVYDLVAYVGSMDVNFDRLPAPNNSYIEVVFGPIAPGRKEEYKIEGDDEFLRCHRFPDIPSVALEFTDVNGAYWRRESDGKLHEVNFRRPYD